METRLDFFHSRMELNHLAMDETQTPDTWGQSFVPVPTSINLTTRSHPLMLGPQNAFLTILQKDPISTSNINNQFSTY